MADMFTKRQRSRIMSRIRGTNTLPERQTRQALSRLGLRVRTHSKALIGVPDIIIPKLRSTVFVHGCFWHQHPGCSRCTMPTTNKRYWKLKLERNTERFKEVRGTLRKEGWRVLVIWECQTKNMNRLQKKLASKLGLPLSPAHAS